MRRRGGLCRVVLALGAAILALAPAADAASLLVYLPDAPVETASRVAAGANELTARLSRAVPSLKLEPVIFRRYADAAAHVAARPDEVAIILAEQSFLLDLPSGFAVDTAWRLERGGRGTYKKVLVVGASSRFQSLADLRGSSLSVAQTAGASGTLYLERVVLRGEIALGSWFGRLEPVADDLSAAANVLYGSTDAALVAEDNPLVVANLGKELRAVYTSPDLSLPVLAVRRGALDENGRRRLDDALRELSPGSRGGEILAALKADAFRPLRERLLQRGDLLQLVEKMEKTLELALPDLASLALPPTPRPDPAQVLYVLGVELPEPPLDDPPPKSAARSGS